MRRGDCTTRVIESSWVPKLKCRKLVNLRLSFQALPTFLPFFLPPPHWVVPSSLCLLSPHPLTLHPPFPSSPHPSIPLPSVPPTWTFFCHPIIPHSPFSFITSSLSTPCHFLILSPLCPSSSHPNHQCTPPEQMFFKCFSSSLPSTSFFVSFAVYPKLNVATKCRVLFRLLYLTENQSWKKLLHGTQLFFSALPNVLPLFVLPLLSTAQRCGLKGRAARRSADHSAIRQQSAILHRNRQTPPSTSMSIKSAPCRRRGQATRMSPFSTYNEVMIHDHSTGAYFLYESLLAVVCHHTSASLLSPRITFDAKFARAQCVLPQHTWQHKILCSICHFRLLMFQFLK